MDHSEPKFVNNFDEHDDDEDTSDTENEDERRLNDNRSDERQSDVQNVPVSEHTYTPEQFIKELNNEIKVLKNEIKELKNNNSDLLQKLKSVNEGTSTPAADDKETVRILQNQIKTKVEENEKLKIKFESLDEELREKISDLAIKASQYSEIEREKQTLENVCNKQKKIAIELTRKDKQKESYLLEKEDEIKRLEKQCEQDRAIIKELNTVQEEHTKEIRRLKNFEDVHPALKDELAQLERRKCETDKKLEQADNVIMQLREEKRAAGEDTQHQILRYRATTEELKKVQEEQEKEISRLHNFESVYPELKYQLAQHERRKLETDKKLGQADNIIRQLKEEIRATGEEKQHLILRLSKLTGAKLTLDNPNITDLSDGKRPTKLAEEFAELYDNEWTDAFEDVNIDDEQAKISFMLKLLMRAHALCQEVSDEHMNRIKTNICKLKLCVKDHSGREQQTQPRQEEKQAMMYVSCEENSSSCAKSMNQRSPRQDHEPHGPSMVASPDTDIEQRETTENDAIDAYEVTAKAENSSDGDTSAQSNIEDIPDVVIDFNSLPHDEKKTIKELRKFIEIRMSDKFEAIATEVIAREYCIDNKTQNTVLNYIRKCVNICWSMCRIDPPVSISFPDVHGDMKLDTSAYKPYTKSGKIIDFIVWPVLYLHEGGPLLSKGVAQGRN